MGKFDDALRMAIRPRNASQVSACETVLMQELVHVLTGEDPRDGEYCMSQLLRFVDALQGMPADLYVGTWRMLSLYVENPRLSTGCLDPSWQSGMRGGASPLLDAYECWHATQHVALVCIRHGINPCNYVRGGHMSDENIMAEAMQSATPESIRIAKAWQIANTQRMRVEKSKRESQSLDIMANAMRAWLKAGDA